MIGNYTGSSTLQGTLPLCECQNSKVLKKKVPLSATMLIHPNTNYSNYAALILWIS